MDQVWRRLHALSKRSAALAADQPGSFEWLTAVGAFWWDARERAGLSRSEVAERLHVPPSDLRLLEFGLASPRDLSRRRVQAHAEALGAPELYAQFRERF